MKWDPLDSFNKIFATSGYTAKDVLKDIEENARRGKMLTASPSDSMTRLPVQICITINVV